MRCAATRCAATLSATHSSVRTKNNATLINSIMKSINQFLAVFAQSAIPPTINIINPSIIRYKPVAPSAPTSAMYTIPIMKKMRPMRQ